CERWHSGEVCRWGELFPLLSSERRGRLDAIIVSNRRHRFGIAGTTSKGVLFLCDRLPQLCITSFHTLRNPLPSRGTHPSSLWCCLLSSCRPALAKLGFDLLDFVIKLCSFSLESFQSQIE